MAKTPVYTKKAVDNYRAKYDFIQTRFPKGTIDRLKAAGIASNNDYISGLVLADLERLEGLQNGGDDLEKVEIERRIEP